MLLPNFLLPIISKPFSELWINQTGSYKTSTNVCMLFKYLKIKIINMLVTRKII